MAEEFFIREFDNGLTLLAQRMEQVRSAAVTLALPAGVSRDPEPLAGAGSVAAGWLLRGAGDRDTHQLNEALDALGCQHYEDARSEHLLLSTAQLGLRLGEVLAIYGDIVRRPQLADETFGACRDLVSQALDGLEDEPMRKCSLMVRERFYPAPLGRNPLGTKDSLAGMTAEGLRRHLKASLAPRGALLAVAGRFEWKELAERVGELLGDWQGEAPAPPAIAPPADGITHLTKPTAQVQITLAYPAATVSHRRYYAARVAQMVLSGGMSSRLFTEVREKRGLAYAVAAQYHSLKEHAGMFVYAGTTPERAQQTLEVTLAELRRLDEGVGEDELARAKTQLKSALVMQAESTPARADAMAGDFYHLRRLRSLEELSAAVDAVTVDDVMDYVRAFPAEKFTMLTIGPDELDTSGVN